jgi:hypothetical protein
VPLKPQGFVILQALAAVHSGIQLSQYCFSLFS